MIYGIILLVLAVVFAIEGFTMQTETAMQQTVQYLHIVISAILLSGSFIVIKLSHIEKTLVEKDKKDIQPESKD